MAHTKYWRLRLRGKVSADQVGASLPADAATILRVDQKADETYVYYATAEQLGAARLEAEEVSVEAVTRVD